MIHTFVEKWHFGFVVWFFGKKHTAAGVFLNKKNLQQPKTSKRAIRVHQPDSSQFIASQTLSS